VKDVKYRKRLHIAGSIILLLFSLSELGPRFIFLPDTIWCCPLETFGPDMHILRPIKDTKTQNVHKRTQKTLMGSTKMCLETSSIRV